MAYEVEFTEPAGKELKGLRRYDAIRIRDAIRGQLQDQPTVQTRNRKPLDDVAAGFQQRRFEHLGHAAQ